MAFFVQKCLFMFTAKFAHTCACTVSPSALSTDQLHATPLPPISTPQPTPMIVDDENTTCSALEKLAVDSDCITDTVEPCDRIYCIDQQIPAKECPVVITLMLCMTPAAVRIEITEEKNVVLNEVVSESQEITVEHHFGLVVNVTLDHFDDAIGLQVGKKMLTLFAYVFFTYRCVHEHDIYF